MQGLVGLTLNLPSSVVQSDCCIVPCNITALDDNMAIYHFRHFWIYFIRIGLVYFDKIKPETGDVCGRPRRGRAVNRGWNSLSLVRVLLY